MVACNMDPLSEVRSVLFETYGILYIGIALSCVLYGITCLQIFSYFRSQRKDRWPIPVLIVVLMILDTIHQVVMIQIPYHYLVIEYGNLLGFAKPIRSLGTALLALTFIYVLCNLFLLRRLWILSGNRWFTGICFASILTQFGLNLEISITVFSASDEYLRSRLASSAMNKAGLAVDAALEVMLALGLVFYLQRSKSGWRKSNNAVTKLIVITMTTGLLPTILTIGALISAIVAPHALYNLFFETMLVQLYINTVLTFLNTRKYLNTQLNAGTSHPQNQSTVLPLDFRASERSTKDASSSAPDFNTTITTASQLESGSAGLYEEPFRSAKLSESRQY